MIARLRLPSGVVGRVVAILLLTVLIEFAASVLLYERANRFAVKDDEARRLAEHLVVSRQLLEDEPLDKRAAAAGSLTTTRYVVRWSALEPRRLPGDPALATMRSQILEWEPVLAKHDLRLRRASPGRNSVVAGGLPLADGSWLQFRTIEPIATANPVPRRILLALIPAIALIVLGGVLVRRTLQPLRQLSEAADRVGSTGAIGSVAVPEEGPGEVRRVVAAFNRMQARIQRLLADRTQALAAVGHDLRTPLARLRLRAEGIAGDDVRDAIARDVDEMEAMVGSLLAFLAGEGDPEAPVRIDLAVLCATLVDDATDHGHDASYDGPDHCELMLRPIGMKRALGNLIDNAIRYGDGVVVHLIDAGETVLVHVEDDGPGIPADRLASVTEPFVRLDTARHRDTPGFGLGLAIAVQAIEAEGGKLDLANRAKGGLGATITLLKG